MTTQLILTSEHSNIGTSTSYSVSLEEDNIGALVDAFKCGLYSLGYLHATVEEAIPSVEDTVDDTVEEDTDELLEQLYEAEKEIEAKDYEMLALTDHANDLLADKQALFEKMLEIAEHTRNYDLYGLASRELEQGEWSV